MWWTVFGIRQYLQEGVPPGGIFVVFLEIVFWIIGVFWGFVRVSLGATWLALGAAAAYSAWIGLVFVSSVASLGFVNFAWRPSGLGHSCGINSTRFKANNEAATRGIGRLACASSLPRKLRFKKI